MDDLEEFDELDILDGSLDSTYKGKTPPGLMALCILTFIGSALILLKDFYLFAVFSLASDINDKFGSAVENEFDAFFGSITLIYILEMISCLGTIAGAILMLRLKKAGFTIYVISTAIYVLGVIWYWFISMQLNLNESLILILLIYLAAPIGFIILYGANKKYLS